MTSWRKRSAGATALVTMMMTMLGSATTARADDLPTEPATTPPPPKLAIGEKGDVVLEDIIGARSSNATSTVAPVAVAPGVGAIGGLGLVSTGPTFSAAWFGMSSTDIETNGATTTVTRYSFHPSADVFVARRVSLGARLGLERTTIQTPLMMTAATMNAISVDPRVGYVIDVTREVAVWPRAKAGVTFHQQSFGAAPRQYRFGADLPLVIRVSQHAAIDFGPDLTYSILDTNLGVVSRTLSIAGRGGLSLVF